MNGKNIDYKGLFTFRMVRNDRIKKMTLRASTDKGIWLNIPNSIGSKEALRFVEDNTEWILKQKETIGAKKIFDFDTVFTTKYHKLQIKQDTHNNFISDFSTDIALIRFPISLKINDDRVQAFIQKSLTRLMKAEAYNYLSSRTLVLARDNNFEFSDLKISNAKTRWGSCSHDNIISLNLQLMRLPDELIDMIILHELCHTQEKNHSVDFWSLLSSVCPSLDSKRKLLNNFSTRNLLK